MQVLKRGVRSRRLVGVAVPLVSVIAIGVGVSSASAATTNYTTPGASQTFVVPAGVTSVAVDAFGAQGGDHLFGPGGRGGEATGSLVVTPGQTLRVRVGGAGTIGGVGGYNGGGKVVLNGQTGFFRGGGGGGASDVRVGGTGLAERVLVAPGGGGGADNVVGGAGGGLTGGDGVQFTIGAGGLGGTPFAGGAAGPGSGGPLAFAGTLGAGGDGTAPPAPSYAGGAGGGGLYGGGGGRGGGLNSSGGGGSALVPAGGSTTPGVKANNGRVRLDYVADAITTVPAGVTGSANLRATVRRPDGSVLVGVAVRFTAVDSSGVTRTLGTANTGADGVARLNAREAYVSQLGRLGASQFTATQVGTTHAAGAASGGLVF